MQLGIVPLMSALASHHLNVWRLEDWRRKGLTNICPMRASMLVSYQNEKFDYCYKNFMLRTQCKAVPRRVPRQDCQQVPTLQVGNNENNKKHNEKHGSDLREIRHRVMTRLLFDARTEKKDN